MADRVCSYCLMDETDPLIQFNDEGRCNHCIDAERLLKERCFNGEEGARKIRDLINEIKKNNSKNEFDCIVGLSGGADSSYLAYIASKIWGLRVLAVHVNAGWNSEIAESNIEKLANKCGLTLHTYVVDWEEVRDLQIAYLNSGLANQDVPQDHVFFAVLYKLAAKENVKYVFTGHNIVTESILPKEWGYNAMDSKQLKYIHKKFGSNIRKSYQTISFFYRYIYLQYFYKIKIINPLNFIDYDKDEAKFFLNNEIGWKDYGMKHGESVFTRFFQNYWLPSRFGFDKRKAHLSSLIVSNKINKQEAYSELAKPLYDSVTLQNDKEYICRKLRIDNLKFDELLSMPVKTFRDYPSNFKLFNFAIKINNYLRNRNA
jgi:N-acetyl sugar amidotransferase